MNTSTPEWPAVSEEQELMAGSLFYLANSALVLMVACFFVYVTGLLTPAVPIEDIPAAWHLRTADYIAQTGTPTGWEWVRELPAADMLSMGSIVVLSTVVIFGFLRTLPVFARRKNAAFVAIALGQIVVLILAATGVLTGGH